MKRDIERTKLFSRKGWLVRAAKGQERWKVAERFERRAQEDSWKMEDGYRRAKIVKNRKLDVFPTYQKRYRA